MPDEQEYEAPETSSEEPAATAPTETETTADQVAPVYTGDNLVASPPENLPAEAVPVDSTVNDPNVGHNILGAEIVKAEPYPIDHGGLVAGPTETINSGVDSSAEDECATTTGGLPTEVEERLHAIESRLSALENKHANLPATAEGEQPHPLDHPSNHWLRDMLADFGIRPN